MQHTEPNPSFIKLTKYEKTSYTIDRLSWSSDPIKLFELFKLQTIFSLPFSDSIKYYPYTNDTVNKTYKTSFN